MIKRKTFYIKRKRKRKKGFTEFARSWGITSPYILKTGRTALRYSGLKGIYWYYFSKEIKKRDYEKWGGLCITCNKYVDPSVAHTCHTFAARKCGFLLLFHPLNNHLGHAGCNNPFINPDSSLFDAINVDKRYGAGTIEMLKKIKETPNQKEWSKKRYEEEIKKLSSYQEYAKTP